MCLSCLSFMAMHLTRGERYINVPYKYLVQCCTDIFPGTCSSAACGRIWPHCKPAQPCMDADWSTWHQQRPAQHWVGGPVSQPQPSASGRQHGSPESSLPGYPMTCISSVPASIRLH